MGIVINNLNNSIKVLLLNHNDLRVTEKWHQPLTAGLKVSIRAQNEFLASGVHWKTVRGFQGRGLVSTICKQTILIQI